MQHLLHKALSVYSELRDEVKAVISASKAIDENYSKYATSQLYYYSERCQSVNLLLQEGKLWDCDILMRSAIECATRFIFVSIADPSERAKRIEEYTCLLNEIDDLQRSEKAKLAADAASTSHAEMMFGGVVLPAEKVAELRARWPKAKRAALRQKWSFSEMVREICQFHRGEVDLRKYASFLHGYGLSSHLIHADQTAIDLIFDRVRREPQECQALVQAHYARLATEQVSILFLCWRVMVYATGIDSKNAELVKNLLALHEQADVYLKEFADTQVDLYL